MSDSYKDKIRGRMGGSTPPTPVYDVKRGSYPLDKLRGVDIEQVEEGSVLIDIGIPWASLSEVEGAQVEYRGLPTRRYREEPYVDALNRVYTDDIDGLRERVQEEEVNAGFVKALTNMTYDVPDSQAIVDGVVSRVEHVRDIIQDFKESGVYYPVWLVEDTDGLLRVADGNHRAAALSIQYPEASMPTWVSSL